MDSLSADGFVMAQSVDINADNNWDDSAIVNVFEDAIRKHRTKNDLLNGGSVRDSRQPAPTTKPEEANISNNTNARRKKARFNSSNMQSNNQDVLNTIEGSSSLASTNKFSSALKAYSKPADDNSDATFTVSAGNSRISVYDQTNLNTAANAAASDTFDANTADSMPHSSSNGYFPSSSSFPQSGSTIGLGSLNVETALNDMLMAWYHSGYATGRYQTLLELQQQQQQQPQQEGGGTV